MLLNEIKKQQLCARKQKDKLKTALLTTLIGETEFIGKEKNRQPTDEEVISVIKKMLKSNAVTVEAYDNNIPYDIIEEKFILESYLPKQLSEKELRDIISNIISDDANANIGSVMRCLKSDYTDQYDAKLASGIARELL